MFTTSEPISIGSKCILPSFIWCGYLERSYLESFVLLDNLTILRSSRANSLFQLIIFTLKSFHNSPHGCDHSFQVLHALSSHTRAQALLVKPETRHLVKPVTNKQHHLKLLINYIHLKGFHLDVQILQSLCGDIAKNKTLNNFHRPTTRKSNTQKLFLSRTLTFHPRTHGQLPTAKQLLLKFNIL